MIRAVALGFAALVGSASAVLAVEGGPIRGGEHDGFTRIVMTIEPTTEWSLETTEGRATIFFPGKRLEFGTGGVFDKIPRSRISDVRVETGASSTTVSVELGCDCRVSTAFVGARYLAVDVTDRSETAPVVAAEPPIESPEARAAREATAVSTAEQLLIRQIERAASQGVVELTDRGMPEPEPEAAEAEAPPDADPAAATDLPAKLIGMAILDNHEQIDATTVYDRDGRSARAQAVAAAVPAVCIADERLDVGGWSNGLPLATQLPPLRRQLVGEFDAPRPQGVRDLARLYVRFGFGAEAEGLLAGFPAAEIEDRSLLVDLARTVDGRPASAEGPLAVAVPCPGRHGLWQALGGVAPAYRDAESFTGVQAEFGALPADLRALLAPGLVDRLIAAGHPAEARVIYDTAIRPGEATDAALDLAAARLAVAEGRPLEAAQALGALVETGGHTPVEALVDLVRLALDAELPVPDRIVTDLRAGALQYRGSDREPVLRRLLAEALASRDELPEAIREVRAAMRDLPGEVVGFGALGVELIAAADPAAVGVAAYAETVLTSTDLIGRTPVADPRRMTIAARLVELGLPAPALGLVAPAAAAGDTGARLVAAEGELGRGRPEAARAALGPLEGTEAATLRARSFALIDAFDEALASLVARGLTEAAEPYAWPAGDWSLARAAAVADPQRLAMASYMTVRTGAAEPPSPSPDPTALDAEAAFQEPLPPLDAPSLDAARRLLAAGGKVGGFVEDVLAAE